MTRDLRQIGLKFRKSGATITCPTIIGSQHTGVKLCLKVPEEARRPLINYHNVSYDLMD